MVQSNRLLYIRSISDVDDDSIRAGSENGSISLTAAAAVDRDRLGDCYGTEATGIERADFTILGSFRNGARIGLTGSGAAAGVCVVANAGYPGARCLGLGQRGYR